MLRRLVGRLHVASKPGFEARKAAELWGDHHFDLAHTHPIARPLFLKNDLERLLAKEVPKRHDVFQALVRELAPGRKSFGLPFLDRHVVSAALAAPDAEKFPSSPMPLLMGSLQGLVPDAWRDSHASQTAWPMGTWMRGVWYEECARGLQVLKDTRGMHADALTALELSFQQKHDSERWRHMWSLKVLGLWLERHGLT